MTSNSIPDGLPILSEGSHDQPSRGACFMEYTALLAGEKFTDSPRCVDRCLAYFMQAVNDSLNDEDRSILVPFLGRSIGLAIPRQLPSEILKKCNEEFPGVPYQVSLAQYRQENDTLEAELRKRVVAKLAKKRIIPKTFEVINFSGEPVRRRYDYDYYDGEMLGTRIFDHLIERIRSEPQRLRIIQTWVEAIHTAYAQAMVELGHAKSAEPTVCGLPPVSELVSAS